MFNTTIVRNEQPAEPTEMKVTVTERRAPTDQSVTLLREMEKEAVSQVMSVFCKTDNSFGITCVTFNDPQHNPFGVTLRWAIRLNGKLLTGDVLLEGYQEVLSCKQHGLLETGIRRKVAQSIAEKLEPLLGGFRVIPHNNS